MNESRTDKLTQVHNRYDLYNYINTLEDKSDYALIMFDIDDFKHINDIYGHLCGDEILKELAKIAKDTFINDFVSRYGGEEFIIILKMNGDIHKSFEMMDSFRKII
ncbi:MAG: GGDEF domain-containing protein, partial [Acholeplasmatales bacterium]|nr:GGDEF domain-containing protein [Acholeplasmatales bacterium]